MIYIFFFCNSDLDLPKHTHKPEPKTQIHEPSPNSELKPSPRGTQSRWGVAPFRPPLDFFWRMDD